LELRVGVQEARIKVGEKQPYLVGLVRRETIQRDVWKMTLKAAAKVERRYCKKNGTVRRFRMGMINGKLSALQWVLGDEWDMLDTQPSSPQAFTRGLGTFSHTLQCWYTRRRKNRNSSFLSK
jgi:hypothetical protein